MSAEMVTLLMAAIPVTELRAAIPLAVTTLDLSPASAFLFAVVGNLLPIPVLYGLLPPFIRWAKVHSPTADRLLEKYFHHLKPRHGEKFQKASSAALAAFVAVPLPGTGVWTGTVIAILFGISARYAVPSLVAGAVVAGVLVLLITTGTLGALGWLL